MRDVRALAADGLPGGLMARGGLKFQSLGQSVALDAKLRKLSAQGFAAAKTAVADRLRALIDEEFETSTDPRGIRWAPRVPHPQNGSWPLLDKSGQMRRSFSVDVNGPRMVFRNQAVSEQGRPYPFFHQKGTVKMVARKLLPDRYLSPKWRAAMKKVTALALERLK